MRLLVRFLLLVVVMGLITRDRIETGVTYVQQQRETNPPTTNQSALVEGNTAFAFDLYHQLASEQDSNLIFSPYSISLNMAVLYAGARGETAAQMAKVLHFNLPQDQFHPAFRELDLSFKRTQDEPLAPTPTVQYINPAVELTLTIANGLWAQTGLPFQQTYLTTLQNNYGVDVKSIDFSGDPQAAQQIMSRWVEENTRGRIKDMPAQGSISSQTQLALINAIYFKGEWTIPFNTPKTHDGTFNLMSGDKATILMMVDDRAEISCLSGDNYQAVDLTYGDSGNMSMMIMIPNAATFYDFESNLTRDLLVEIQGNISRTNAVTFQMPRFRFESKFDLQNTLSTMGMTSPFSGNADFTGMSLNSGLYISYAEHKATITVDEQGTEASGVTNVSLPQTGGGSPCDNEIIADRPFIFIIYDHQTNTILFMGRVMNPAL